MAVFVRQLRVSTVRRLHHSFSSRWDGLDWPAIIQERLDWEGDKDVLSHLRSDHAGETGAVFIYKGADWAMGLSPSGTRYSPACRSFVREHMLTEQQHLDALTKILPARHQSALLPVWKAAGFLLGAMPALVGEAALFCTIEAVESFVEIHYNDHILPWQEEGKHPELVNLLTLCRDEEIHHKQVASKQTTPWLVANEITNPFPSLPQDAAGRWGGKDSERSWYSSAWAGIVEKGSAAAVAVCRRI
ncbi:unnamed protein product [Chrysoparadoxa australica]